MCLKLCFEKHRFRQCRKTSLAQILLLDPICLDHYIFTMKTGKIQKQT